MLVESSNPNAAGIVRSTSVIVADPVMGGTDPVLTVSSAPAPSEP